MRCRIQVLLFYLLFFAAPYPQALLKAQYQTNSAIAEKTPADIQFTSQIFRSGKDLEWSRTYFESYQMTHEVSYLKLSAQFCLKSINRLTETQKQLSHTNRFYNLADQKRLRACQFYDMLKSKSFLLLPKHHLGGSGKSCQKSF